METAPELVIRPATTEDAKDFHRIFCESIDAIDEGFYDSSQRQAWQEAVAGDSWATRILELTFFVAEQDGVVLGFISWHQGEIVHVYAVGRKGIGQALMDYALAHMPPGETTLTSSLNAEKFYQRFGFIHEELISKERGGVHIPCIRMRRPSV